MITDLYNYQKLFLDLGLGYGISVLNNSKNYLYTNIYFTYFNLGTESIFGGPSLKVELEYRHKFKALDLIIAPYFRVASINYKNNHGTQSAAYFFAGRIGIAHNFKLKN